MADGISVESEAESAATDHKQDIAGSENSPLGEGEIVRVGCATSAAGVLQWLRRSTAQDK